MSRGQEPSRVALYGRQGAGKTTSAQLIVDICASFDLSVRRVRLAAPLYRLQNALYLEAGRPLTLRDEDFQDSEVLAFFAMQLRRINPNALTNAAGDALAEAARDGIQIVLCEDS